MTKEKIIEKFQKLGYQSDTAVTLIHQYTTTERSSLLTGQVSNRNSKGWVKGEYVIAYYDGEVVSVDKNLDAWKLLAEKYKNQYLILEVNKGEWKVYNYNGEELGGEEYIEKLFEKRDVIQKIYYGCPGSGKSYKVQKITETFNNEGFDGLTSIERQQAYQKYLDEKHGHKKSYKGGKVNMDALKHPKLMKYIVSCTDYSINSLFEIYKEEDFQNIINALADNEEYKNDSITKGSGCHWETGLKSYGDFLKEKSSSTEKCKDVVFRTTFHPDTDYATFVGCYKPSMKDGVIEYSYTPQVFTDAYITAWENTNKPVYLVIEEINRGNCAQIFGDLFQLLDRNKIGKSEYSIKADKDLAIYIEQELGAGHEGIKNGELCLPPNLNIIATMNTSDQSLFPMDSAFKRRWDWEYVPIDYSKDIDSGKFTITIGEEEYLWVDFLKKVNEKIYDVTNSEDKQMGNFFIKKSVNAEEFVNKVMFYLWNEVCKEEYRTNRNFFRKKEDEEFKFVDLFDGDKGDKIVFLNEFMTYLGVESIKEEHVENEELEENKE